jgi:hypothetical protein
LFSSGIQQKPYPPCWFQRSIASAILWRLPMILTRPWMRAMACDRAEFERCRLYAAAERLARSQPTSEQMDHHPCLIASSPYMSFSSAPFLNPPSHAYMFNIYGISSTSGAAAVHRSLQYQHFQLCASFLQALLRLESSGGSSAMISRRCLDGVCVSQSCMMNYCRHIENGKHGRVDIGYLPACRQTLLLFPSIFPSSHIIKVSSLSTPRHWFSCFDVSFHLLEGSCWTVDGDKVSGPLWPQE